MADIPQPMEVMEIEPHLGGSLQYRNLELIVERASTAELRKLCLILGEQALVVLPAANRWLIKEACRPVEDWRAAAMERMASLGQGCDETCPRG